MKNWKSDFEDT